MAKSTATLVSLCIIWVLVSSLQSPSSATPHQQPICPLQSPSPVDSLDPRCHLPSSAPSAIEVNGFFLDRTLSAQKTGAYTSVLFYASWCPFSKDARLTFEALSSMFPQIEHLAVEQSSAVPSVFSRYGIHSFPTVLMVSQSSRIRYRGSKDLRSLVNFYKKTTGFEPVSYVPLLDQSVRTDISRKFAVQSWTESSSFSELLSREVFLLLSVAFLVLRALAFVFPIIVSHLRSIWVSYAPQLNFFGERSQIMGRVLNMINVKRIWGKLRLIKARNLHRGANNARVWASSLASVSLGESSSPKSS